MAERVTRKPRFQIDWHYLNVADGGWPTHITDDEKKAHGIWTALSALEAHGLVDCVSVNWFYPEIAESDWETPEWAE